MAIDLTKLEKKFIDLFANVTKEEFEQWLLTKTKPMAQQRAMFSREDKMKLLENANTFKWLTIKQLLKLIWWEWFNKKKIEAFYNGLNMGKAAIFAYKDADQYYTKTYGNNQNK